MPRGGEDEGNFSIISHEFEDEPEVEVNKSVVRGQESKRYVNVIVSIPAHELKKLIGAAEEDVAESAVMDLSGDMAGNGKYKRVMRVPMLLTKRQIASLHGGAKRVRMSAAQLRAMRGRGILMDTAKLGSAVIQNVADSFLPNSGLANDLSDILLEAGDVIERAFTGQNQYDYETAAKQNNNAIEIAKRYIEAPEKERRKAHAVKRANTPGPLKKLIPKDFEAYDAQMAALAVLPKQTAKSAKEARFKRLRGDAKAKEAASKLVEIGKQKLIEKLPVVGDVLEVADVAKKITSDPKKAASVVKEVAAKVASDPSVVAEVVKETIKSPSKTADAAKQYFASLGVTPEQAASMGITYPGAGKRGRGRPKKVTGGIATMGGASMGDDIADYIAATLKGDTEEGSGIATYGGRLMKGTKAVKSLSLQKKR